MAITALSAPVRDPRTGGQTTIAALAAAGRIRFTRCNMETKKRAGERQIVTRYFADLIERDGANGPGSSDGWQISRMAFESRTTGTVTV